MTRQELINWTSQRSDPGAPPTLTANPPLPPASTDSPGTGCYISCYTELRLKERAFIFLWHLLPVIPVELTASHQVNGKSGQKQSCDCRVSGSTQEKSVCHFLFDPFFVALLPSTPLRSLTHLPLSPHPLTWLHCFCFIFHTDRPGLPATFNTNIQAISQRLVKKKVF